MRSLSSTVVTLLLAGLLQACATAPSPDVRPGPGTFFDAQVRDHNGRVVDLETLADALADADVIVVGEFHGHQGAHLLQARLQAALHHRNPDQVLALEAFNLDHQAPLERYLAGGLGEEEMMEDARAWDNYQAAYRPLVEYARRHDLPVVASNAPADVVRCVGRQGADYLAQLPQQQRRRLPEQPFPEVAGYRQRFMETMGGNGHGQPSAEGQRRLENTYLAQLLRDSTMADRILRARQSNPGHQVLMITGTFHSENRQGLVAVLEQRAPGLAIRVLTPNMLPPDLATDPVTDIVVGDYRYDLWPVPIPYRNEDRERAAMMERFRQAPAPHCR